MDPTELESTPECFISAMASEAEKADIRSNACFGKISPYNDSPYCLGHFPSDDKCTDPDFVEQLNTRILSFLDFRYIYFPIDQTSVDVTDKGFSVDFSKTTFSEFANFSGAIFKCPVTFKNAIFSGGVYFRHTYFTKVSFKGTTFENYGEFDQAKFTKDVNFYYALFAEGSETSFKNTRFSDVVTFEKAHIRGYVSFIGTEDNKIFNENNRIEMDHIRVAGDDKLLFSNVRLRPHWFVNCDPRKFIFTNAHWGWSVGFGSTRYVRKEIRSLRERKIDLRLLKIACRQLADNAEANNRYEEGVAFRYMALESERLAEKRSSSDKFLNFLYYFSSGFGEKWHRAFLVLFLIWLLPFLFYMNSSAIFTSEKTLRDEVEGAAEYHKQEFHPGLPSREAAFYSLNVMAFQKPDPKPANESWLTRLVVTLQTILGPVQATLLLLAIRRKFMR